MFFEMMQRLFCEWEYDLIAKELRISVAELKNRIFMESLTLEECLLAIRVTRNVELQFYILNAMDNSFRYKDYGKPMARMGVEHRLN